ncbi:mitochondrial phosphate carrier protein [Tilletia horrida]|nr:mitochondrial phosphate carrier protein [Tilletia horrida]
MATHTTAKSPAAPSALRPSAPSSPSSSSSSSSSSSTDLVPTFSLIDYGKFLAAGGLCATITHGMMTPVDVVKTRIQLEPPGQRVSMLTMGRNIIASEGPGGLLTGFGPTAVGYLVQGGLKWVFTEDCAFFLALWKRQFVLLAGSQQTAEQYRTAIYLTGASIAEVFATMALTPLEAARIRMVSERGFASNLFGALSKMTAQEGLGGLYAGIIPILCKQVPYAIGQFTTNEFMHELVEKTMDKKAIEENSKAGEVTIQLGCGLVAGAVAAVLSHPADTLLSKINQGGGGSGGTVSRLVKLAQETGPVRIWAGLGPRILMTAGLVSGQFLLYAQIKTALGAPAGITIAKSSETKSS